MVPKWSQNNPKIIPRPTPHPQIGKKNCHEANKIEKNNLGVVSCILTENDKRYIQKDNIREHTH